MNRDLKEDLFTEKIGRLLRIPTIKKKFNWESRKLQWAQVKEPLFQWINKKRETSLNFINRLWETLTQTFKETMKKLTTLKNC